MTTKGTKAISGHHLIARWKRICRAHWHAGCQRPTSFQSHSLVDSWGGQVVFSWLVVWNISIHFLFFHIVGIIIPTDWYFSEGLKPPSLRWSFWTGLYHKFYVNFMCILSASFSITFQHPVDFLATHLVQGNSCSWRMLMVPQASGIWNDLKEP